MTDLFGWTDLFPARTGLPVTVWVGVRGVVATDPHDPENVAHRDEVSAWIRLNRMTLLDHWNGVIDGGEMALRSKRLPP